MDTTQLASLVDHVRTMPATEAGRDRALYRLTDRYAAVEAASALHAAAARSRERPDDGANGPAVLAASAMWNGATDGLGWLADNAASHDRLCEAVASPAFLALVPGWIRELREIAATRPDTGACTLATAFQLWSWTMKHFQSGAAARSEWAPSAVAELSDEICVLLAARAFVLEVAGKTPPCAQPEHGLRADLCHVHAAHASATAGSACAELVYGYRKHLVWDAEGVAACYNADELDELEGLMPGLACSAYATGDVVETNGAHAAKAGPCARFDGLETFTQLRARLDRCLTGARLARERAASALMHAAAPPPATSGGSR